MIKPQCWGTWIFLQETPILLKGLLMRKVGFSAYKSDTFREETQTKRLEVEALPCPLL